MTFQSMGLSDALLKAISKKGYTTPSPIQAQAIQPLLEGRDMLASAQTGTGKTAGFTLPMLQLLAKKPATHHRKIRALVLTPTRELAAQVQQNVIDYSLYLDIKSTVIFGGVKQGAQVKILKAGIDILVATPGRLLDLENQGLLSLRDIEILVLDEADRMLDMGFLRDIKRVLSLLPAKRQNLLFSATFSREIKNLSNSILNNPITIEISPEITTAEKVNQTLYHLNKKDKAAFTIQLIKEGNWSQVLIFMRTKHGANKLAQKLDKSGVQAAAIHGNKSQNARTQALAGFKAGKIRVLVATDIAARGLDIPLLPYVMNYELPNVPEDYVHRIGRTGRAGESGDAISLVSHEEMSYVKGIEKLLGETLPLRIAKGFEPSAEAPPAPKPQGRQQNNRGGRHGGRGNSRGTNPGGSDAGEKKKTGFKPRRRY